MTRIYDPLHGFIEITPLMKKVANKMLQRANAKNAAIKWVLIL